MTSISLEGAVSGDEFRDGRFETSSTAALGVGSPLDAETLKFFCREWKKLNKKKILKKQIFRAYFAGRIREFDSNFAEKVVSSQFFIQKIHSDQFLESDF